MIEIELNEKQKQVIESKIQIINNLKNEQAKEESNLISMFNLLSDEVPEKISAIRIEADKLILE